LVEKGCLLVGDTTILVFLLVLCYWCCGGAGVEIWRFNFREGGRKDKGIKVLFFCERGEEEVNE